jgi:hypothetical protein
MGYTTNFEGHINVVPPLQAIHREYLLKFEQTRRMRRDPAIVEGMDDETRKAVGLPVGPEGAYFVGGGGDYGQDRDPSVLDYNEAPEGQPGLWCKWTPSEDGTKISWSGAEKFYEYTEWMNYLIVHFLKPWGYKCDGIINWQGEDIGDVGHLKVVDNVVIGVDGEYNPEAGKPPKVYEDDEDGEEPTVVGGSAPPPEETPSLTTSTGATGMPYRSLDQSRDAKQVEVVLEVQIMSRVTVLVYEDEVDGLLGMVPCADGDLPPSIECQIDWTELASSGDVEFTDAWEKETPGKKSRRAKETTKGEPKEKKLKMLPLGKPFEMKMPEPKVKKVSKKPVKKVTKKPVKKPAKKPAKQPAKKPAKMPVRKARYEKRRGLW